MGPDQPTLGCAATPTGLSTTTMSSSWNTICMPSTSVATTTARRGAGIDASRIEPGMTRSDLAGARPSSGTWPSATSSLARVRDRPSRRARALSTRSPARPSGTWMTLCSSSVLVGSHDFSSWVPSRRMPRHARQTMMMAAKVSAMSATLPTNTP